jgi:hypothetical protein
MPFRIHDLRFLQRGEKSRVASAGLAALSWGASTTTDRMKGTWEEEDVHPLGFGGSPGLPARFLNIIQSDSSQARMSGLREPVASPDPGEVTSHAANAFAFIARSISMYRFVVEILTCPSQLRITFTSTPDCNRCIAVVWRSVWGVTRRSCRLGTVVAALVVYRWMMSAIPDRLKGRP